jgi:hypothetical protein
MYAFIRFQPRKGDHVPTMSGRGCRCEPAAPGGMFKLAFEFRIRVLAVQSDADLPDLPYP